jgi:predicted transcriptional regulator
MTTEQGKRQRLIGGRRQAVREELAIRYSQGASIRTLAAESGRSYGLVHRLLTEAGVTMRSRGGNNRWPPKRPET